MKKKKSDFGHKDQHFVARSYLAAWCDPAAPATYDPYVWTFAKDGSSPKRRAPENLFTENNLYTIYQPDGARDLRIERSLSQLEGDFVGIRSKLESHRPLDGREDTLLRAFVIATQSRIPSWLRHWQSQWGRVADMGRRIQTAIDEGRGDMYSGYPTGGAAVDLSAQDVEQMAAAPLGTWIAASIHAALPIMKRMQLTVLETDDRTGFITSDNPCAWVNPDAATMPGSWRSPGLVNESLEITVPSSPRQALFLSWHRGLPTYVRVDAETVATLNQRTRIHANERFVVCSDETRPEWF